MNHHNCIKTISALSFVLELGVAGAVGQVADNPPKGQGQGTARVAPGVDFRSSKWLDDRSIVNDGGDKIASVSDLILDRGTGRITYLVVRTGTTMGLGGKTIAIPYSDFRWDSKDQDYLMTSTADQLKTYPEFSADEWSAMMESHQPSMKSRLHDFFGGEHAKTAAADPYAGSLDTGKRVHIAGEVTKVERTHMANAGEQVVVTVSDSSNNGSAVHRVALGPSWFVNGSAATPMRGDKIVVDALEMREGDGLVAATDVRIGDRDLHLRNSDGTPAWTLETVESDGKTYNASYWRLMLASTLRGKKVDCRGNECGKVNDLIVERRSGAIAFLSIDPNQNFLGIGHARRLVPWGVATVALDGTVRIDASKEMVLASPETPSDLTNMNTTADMVYNAYQIPAPRFDTSGQASAMPRDDRDRDRDMPRGDKRDMPSPNDAWAENGAIISSIDHRSTRTFTGKIDDMTDEKFGGGIANASAVKMKDGDHDEVILLGPSWFMTKQKLPCKEGDQATIEACRATVNGKSYWLAQSIECNGGKVVLIDRGVTPAWNKRDQ
jgi:sporulation protein YlmC with PRC-barrel domain